MGHCRCPKDLYVRRTRLRISANTRSWERAREEAHAYADQYDPKLIAQRTEKEKKPEPVFLSDAIEKFIEARRLVNSSEKTIANLKPDCYQFLKYVNQRNRTQPESDKFFRVDRVTTGLLNEWMATWK
jgi:hypothetical protein